MGYYDFNDHFWSPNEACKQKSEIVVQEEQYSIIGKLHIWLRSLKHKNVESFDSQNELKLPYKNSEN